MSEFTHSKSEGYLSILGIAAEIDRAEAPWIVMKTNGDDPSSWDIESCVPHQIFMLAGYEAFTACVGHGILDLQRGDGVPDPAYLNPFNEQDKATITGTLSLLTSLMKSHEDSREFRLRMGSLLASFAQAFCDEQSAQLSFQQVRENIRANVEAKQNE